MAKRFFSSSIPRRTAAAGIILAMSGSLLSACSTSPSENTAEKHVLRIGVLQGSSEADSYYRQQYTDTFEYSHPNIELQIVPAIDTSNRSMDQNAGQQNEYDELKKLMTGPNPVDVVLIDYKYLKRMTQDNLLKQLDPLIAKDKFDLNDFVPSVIDTIKAAGDNNVYALTPTFSSNALFYNKKIFQDAGLNPPVDGMQWQDVLNLARQVSKGDGSSRTFGFAFDSFGMDSFYALQSYTDQQQLKMYDDKAEKMLVDNDKWLKAWDTVSGLYKDKVTPTADDIRNSSGSSGMVLGANGGKPSNPYQDIFTSGKVAMMVNGYSYISYLKQAKDTEGKVKGFTVPDWGVVTVPTHSEAPNIGMGISLGQLTGINNKAQNPDDAWEFVKFLNGKEWTKLKSRSTFEIPARQEFITSIGGMDYNIKAFDTLQPAPPSNVDLDKIATEKPGVYNVSNDGTQLFQSVIDGKMTSAEALKEWAAKGDVDLHQPNTNPSGNAGG